MIPLRSPAFCTVGLLVGFAVGWFFKPAPVPETAGQAMDGGNRRTALPASLAGKPVSIAGGTWLDAAAADAAAVRGAARPGQVNQVLLEKLGAVLAMNDPGERLAKWRALLPLMRMEDAGAVRALLRENRVEGRAFIEETAAFWHRCGRMDSIAALSWAAEEDAWSIPDVLGGWASLDSSAAIKWLKDNSERIEPTRALAGLVRGLAAQSPDAAVEFLLANGSDPFFRPSLGMAMDLIIQRRGITAARQWFRDLAESDAPDPSKAASLETLLSQRDEGLGATQRMELIQAAAHYAGEPWFSGNAAHSLGHYIGELDPAAGMRIMKDFRGDSEREIFMDSLLEMWSARNPGSMGEWLKGNRASPSFDTMASSLAKHLSEEDPDAARGWAAQISDPVKREALEKELSDNQGNFGE